MITFIVLTVETKKMSQTSQFILTLWYKHLEHRKRVLFPCTDTIATLFPVYSSLHSRKNSIPFLLNKFLNTVSQPPFWSASSSNFIQPSALYIFDQISSKKTLFHSPPSSFCHHIFAIFP